MSADRMEAVVRRERVVDMPDGKKMVITGLGLQDFVAARDEALRLYRRAHVQAVEDIADLIADEDERQRRRMKAFDEAQSMTVDSLPTRVVSIPVRDRAGRPVRAVGKPGEYMTVQRETEYTIWWMSETPSGRLFMTWRSLRGAPGQESITLDEADTIFRDAAAQLQSIANEVGELSSTSLLADDATVETLGNSTGRTSSNPTGGRPEVATAAAGLSRRQRRNLARLERRRSRRDGRA
jgi:hypothetical protein